MPASDKMSDRFWILLRLPAPAFSPNLKVMKPLLSIQPSAVATAQGLPSATSRGYAAKFLGCDELGTASERKF